MINHKKAVLMVSTVLACAVGGAVSTVRPMTVSAQPVVQQVEPIADPAVQASPASREQIEELLELTNADSLNEQVLEQIIGQFRQVSPEVPDEWWDGFMARALNADINALIIPIYERHYTAEEIDGLIEFYQSPLGQSLLAKTPAVTQESIAVGQAWGLEIVEELMAELEADGFEFLPATRRPVTAPVPAATPGEETLDNQGL